ncbi:MAG: type II toxin-antitoxin system VapC family toxin [Candidatus Kapabacteria bacterium]|jgi:predicted nucleic acid-binding protein|nr:type II toxin-antitoxin system VapC family toxin [Candidatus Kapabacteria bacterium]
MINSTIVVDTSILIDFIRKKDKSKAVFVHLEQRYIIVVSAITVTELMIGATSEEKRNLHKQLLAPYEILPLTGSCAFVAATIVQSLKRKNRLIALADTLIAATGIANNLPLATLNREHFSRIDLLPLLNLPEIE